MFESAWQQHLTGGSTAVESANKGMGIPVPKQQVEHIAVRAGTDFEAFY